MSYVNDNLDQCDNPACGKQYEPGNGGAYDESLDIDICVDCMTTNGLEGCSSCWTITRAENLDDRFHCPKCQEKARLRASLQSNF